MAKTYHVPPYIICDDKTLSDMARRRPVTMEGMMTVHGMGAVKSGKYGAAFLKVIREYDKTRTTVTVGQGKEKEKPLSLKEKNELRRAYLDGLPIAQMARTLGHTEAEIRAALRSMDLII